MFHSPQKAAKTFFISYFERTTLFDDPIWIKMTFLSSIMMVGNHQKFIYKLRRKRFLGSDLTDLLKIIYKIIK